MADVVNIGDPAGASPTVLANTKVLTDDCTTGHAQIIKLAYSADGSATLIPADADGLLVNLGANNDVTIATLPALPAGSANIGDVDVLTVPAPLSTTGNGTAATALRVTIASDTTGVVAVTDNASSLSVDWNGTQPVTGSGTATGALRVELPTNGTGTLATVSTVTTVTTLTGTTTLTPGTGAANLGKAEDAGHTTGDVGVMALGVRNDADAAFGADLDYTPMSTDAGGNANVRSRKDRVRVTVQSAGLTTAATAYAAGDTLGNQFTIAGAARASGGGGMIVGVVIVSAADTIGAIDAVFTDSSVTLQSNDAAYAISDADALKVVALVQLAGAYDIGNNRICQAYNLAVPYVCSGGTSLYCGLITRYAIPATPFGAATDIQLIVYLERD